MSAARASRTSLVIDADDGVVLQATGPNLRSFPASTVKMMTLYLTFAAIEAGTLSWDEQLLVSAGAANQAGQSLGLRAGDRIKAHDAVLGVIVDSANDAAVVLAERLAGSQEAFAQRMNAKAHELGMTRSVFRNASGLNDPEQVVTARDLALLAQALRRDFPREYPLFSARVFRYGSTTYPTVNGFVADYPGADGIKTGFTCAAGYNIVASAVRAGRRLIAVVLGETSREVRLGHVAHLLDAAFAAGAPDPPTTIADLDPARNGDADPAATGVIAPACAGMMAVAGRAGAEQLPGWGVEVGGGFRNRAQAEAAGMRVQGAQAMGLGSGRLTVVRSALSGHALLRPLIVGLTAEAAVGSCVRMRRTGAYCIVLPPPRLEAVAERSALLSARLP
jgi:D-alanyl-D-alanine carboxypeptidase